MKFLLGILTGIFAGLMLAPASGSETRRRISQSANDFAETSREKFQDMSESARQKARQVSDMANEKVQHASEYVRQKTGDITRAGEAASDAAAEKIQRRTA